MTSTGGRAGSITPPSIPTRPNRPTGPARATEPTGPTGPDLRNGPNGPHGPNQMSDLIIKINELQDAMKRVEERTPQLWSHRQPLLPPTDPVCPICMETAEDWGYV